MSIIFAENVSRKISEMNFNTYVNGIIHPDRVMGEHDIVYTMQGEWEIFLEDVPLYVKPDDVIVLPAGIHHYGLVPCLPNTKTIYIHFSSVPEDVFYADNNLSPEYDGIELLIVTNCRNRPSVKHHFQDIVATKWQETARKEQKCSLMIELLLNEISECKNEHTTNFDKTSFEIARLIQETPDRFFTGKKLSALYYTSERTLRDNFVKTYGQSIYQYQINNKLQQISTFLVIHPELKLNEVAKNFGFYDEYHMSRCFKKKYGLSPGKYRKIAES